MHFDKVTKKLSSYSKVSVTYTSLLGGKRRNILAAHLVLQLFIFASALAQNVYIWQSLTYKVLLK